MKKRILFTGGGGAATEALWRYLSEKYDAFFADACVDSIDPVIPVDRRIEIPYADASNFISAMQDVAAEKNIDLIIPGVDEELLLFCEARNSSLPKILLPSLEFVATMLDKLKSMEAIKSVGLSAPQTVPVIAASTVGFPLVVKPRSGRGSRGVHILNSIDEIQAYKLMYRVDDDKLIAQMLMRGDEYTVLVAGDDYGNLIAVVPVKVVQKKGITIRAQIDVHPAVVQYAKEFHDAFKPSGVYNIQCIVDKDGFVLPFEVNPRVSTTFCLSIAAGFDPFSDRPSYMQATELFLPKESLCLTRNWSNHIFAA